MAWAVSKNTLALLSFLLMWLPSNVAAQQSNPMFYKEIHLTHKPYTLQSLTREMQRQSGITFSYNASKISPDKRIRIKDDKLTVEKLLSLIKKKSGISYKIINGSHIIYTEPPNSRNKIAAKKEPRNKKKMPRGPETGQTTLIAIKEEDNGTDTQRIVIIGDSSVAAPFYMSGGGGGSYGGYYIQKYPVIADEIEEEWDDPYANLNSPANRSGLGDENPTLRFLKKNALISGGFSITETYYFNPTLRAGFTFLHGIASYSLGSYPHWRYGLGTLAKINNNWDIGLSFTTGANVSGAFRESRTDTIPGPPPQFPDTIPSPPIIRTQDVPILVQSRLHTFTVSAEWRVSRSFSVSGGATLNILQTNYTSNGAPFTFGSLPIPIPDADSRYRTINPVYTLGNDYDPGSSSNTKMWIGLQIMFSYRLSFFDKD
jgi:hypothetical protein